MFGASDSAYTWAWFSSGSRIMTMSASLTASDTSFTARPAPSAFFQLAPPLRSAIVTFTPESDRFCACAWPCEP